MMQIARNETMDEWGFLKSGQYLIHDRDTKFCPAFKQIIDEAKVKRLPLPSRSPDLNAFAARWVRAVKQEALSQFILFGENALRHVLKEYVDHFHTERSQQGIGNVIPFPNRSRAQNIDGAIHCQERLGGALKFYDRKAA